MNKKILLAGALGTGIFVIGALVPLAVFAQTANTTATTFVQKLAEKLGIDQSTVQSAVDSVHTDMQAERLAQLKTDVAAAVTNGKLTQRQADLLLAIEDVKPTLARPDPTTQVDPSTLTEDQRKAQMEAIRTQMDQALVDALNAKGLSTTVAEIQSTETAARDAGLRSGFFVHGHGMRGFF